MLAQVNSQLSVSRVLCGKNIFKNLFISEPYLFITSERRRYHMRRWRTF